MKKTSEVVVDVPTPSSSSSGSSGSSDSASISSSSSSLTTTTKEGNGEEVDWSKFSKHKERKQPEAKQEEEKKEEEKPFVLVEPVVEGRLAETVPEEDAKAGIFHEEHIVVAPREMAVATEDDHHKNMPENEYIAPISKRPEDNQLNEALAKRYSHENIVMVTGEQSLLRFRQELGETHSRLRDEQFLVGAMDNELLVRLIDDKVPTFAMQSGLTTADFGWGSKNFHQMGRKKIELIHLFTKMGFDILVSDVDTAWMKNPIPFIRKFPEVDVLTSSDSLSDFAETEWSLERTTTGMANIGIMLLRKSAGALAKEWVHVLEKDENIWDQNAFNDLMRKGRGKFSPIIALKGTTG